MISPPSEIAEWIKTRYFDSVPMATAFIDQAFNIVYANKAFEETFGLWRHQKCYTVYKNRGTLCPDCKGAKAFKDGNVHVNEEVGINKSGKLTKYIKKTLPIKDKDGDIPFLVEMCMDVTEIEQIRREHQLLFDQVPCQILVIDRNYRIVRTNSRMHQMFGNVDGHHCFQCLKGSDHICAECTARQTFEDGKLHSGYHEWRMPDGEIAHLHVITVPLKISDDHFDMVMEMAVDVTRTINLTEGLNYARTVLETLVNTSLDGILALDPQGRITLTNPAVLKLLAAGPYQLSTWESFADLLSPDVVHQIIENKRHVNIPETTITRFNGETVPVRLVGNPLMLDGKSLGTAFSLQDLSEIKRLQNEKLEAEKLAAVGQTVAGLAHGVKNLITALEGGMYMLTSGVRKADIDRLENGMDMLSRNIGRMSSFVKAFLSFSKGRKIIPAMIHPEDIIREVMEMYKTKADSDGIRLTLEPSPPMKPVCADPESLHECLANLVGNAIDACRMKDDKTGLEVTVRCFEEDSTIRITVADNGCGMDEDTKKKLFTTFFTTKGLEGTGLGLLMSRKNIQDHGGTIDVSSEPGKGSTFHIRLPRNQLPRISDT